MNQPTQIALAVVAYGALAVPFVILAGVAHVRVLLRRAVSFEVGARPRLGLVAKELPDESRGAV